MRDSLIPYQYSYGYGIFTHLPSIPWHLPCRRRVALAPMTVDEISRCRLPDVLVVRWRTLSVQNVDLFPMLTVGGAAASIRHRCESNLCLSPSSLAAAAATAVAHSAPKTADKEEGRTASMSDRAARFRGILFA